MEDYPLGTAGGLKNAEDHLEDEEGPFVATNGDVLTGLDLAEVIEAHKNSDALATITLTSVEDPSAYGLVEVDHRLGVKRFVEKPGSEEVHTSLINAGIYVLEREVLHMIPKDQEVSIEREVFPELQAMGKLRAYVSSAYWRDIGTPRSYLAASHDVLSGAIGRSPEFRYMSVDQTVDVSKDVTLLPPVSIAEGCEVGSGATIGGAPLRAGGASSRKGLWWREASSSKGSGGQGGDCPNLHCWSWGGGMRRLYSTWPMRARRGVHCGGRECFGPRSASEPAGSPSKRGYRFPSRRVHRELNPSLLSVLCIAKRTHFAQGPSPETP